MQFAFSKSRIALATIAAVGVSGVATIPVVATAAKTAGRYVSGDFHNHTTCSDGSISMQKLVKKSTDTVDTPWGLDWFVQAGHGNSGGTRNCTLIEDETLSTPAYPFIPGTSPNTTWTASIGATNVKGDTTSGVGYMWRWQSMQEYQYPVLEYLSAYRNLPLFLGNESIVAGHEHASMSVITGQIPAALDTAALPNAPGPITARYTPLGNANALSQWNYCFDLGDTDRSRGDATGTTIGNNWECSVPNSNSASDPLWNIPAQKLITSSVNATGAGTDGHRKTVEAIKWMAAFHPGTSYYVPAHLERAGIFSPDGSFGFNVEHLRDFNNAGPNIAFGMESQPGHGASANRGEYQVLRNAIPGFPTRVDSAGGTSYGGTGVYASLIGGLWDSMLGEGRNYWFFASSDWHNRGMFGPDDRRSTQDFLPGEYQRDYVLVRNGADKLRPQTIVDGLRTGNSFASSGQLIDRLAFIACASYAGPAARSNASVEALAVAAATNDTDIDRSGCATMGEKLVVRPGAEIVVAVVVRDPDGANYSPYSFDNPSLAQIGIRQPINRPVLDHIDVIRGMVNGYRQPGAADYAGAWPTNTNWLRADGSTADLSVVPAAAKNTTAALIRTFNGSGALPWAPVTSGVDNTTFLKMSFRMSGVAASQYIRLRGTNMPPSVPFESDANGNPMADVFTNAGDATRLRIPCSVTGTNVPDNGVNFTGGLIDGCPRHLPVVNNVRYVAFDVAAWADLWFYSNPIFVEVSGSTVVAGIK